jgi:hypothetical protein
MIRALTLGIATAALLSLSVTGCSGDVSPRFGGAGEMEEPGFEQYQEGTFQEPEIDPPTGDEIRQITENAVEELGLNVWSCTYSPTYDDNWYNDVECRNGADVHRPSLREWDSFVTEAEMMESAREYEAELNAGG